MSQTRHPLVIRAKLSGIINRDLKLYSNDSGALLYTVEFHHLCGPDVIVHRGDEEGPVLGIGKFRAFSRKIDVDLSGVGIEENSTIIRKPEIFKNRHDFALLGRRFDFKTTSQGSDHILKKDIKLVDYAEPDAPVLFFRRQSGFAKWGYFEIVKQGLATAEVDAFVICTIAVLVKLRRQRNSSAAAGAAAF